MKRRQPLHWSACLLATALVGGAQAAQPSQEAWGTFRQLFAADSPWNSRPVNPVLGDAQIPPSTYYPAVQEGIYSTGVFLARPTDGPVTVLGLPGKPGLWNPDAEQYQPSIAIPRWPADTLPAQGNDGHADIVDPESGIVHSFYQLKRIDGVWRARQYAWSSLNGRGWGDPAHYFQGARAAGVPSAGGLIRTHEVNDGEPSYRHALAMSLTFNGLSASPTYVYPATASDSDASTTNSGPIPMGTLLMLPASFDARSIANVHLRKIAETLKRHGAYVVDRNVGTPFVIYAEIGSGLSVHKPDGKWDNASARDLHRIREQLRPVVSTSGWLDGRGQRITTAPTFNLLSMRGAWQLTSGDKAGRFDTWHQALAFEAGSEPSTMVNEGRNMFGRLTWAAPQPGQVYQLTARNTGDARLRMVLRDCDKPDSPIDSQALQDGQRFRFTWPAKLCGTRLEATSGGKSPSSVGGELMPVSPDRRPARQD